MKEYRWTMHSGMWENWFILVWWLIVNDWDADSLNRFIRQQSEYLLVIDEEYDSSKAKLFEYTNAHDLSVFDTNCLKGIERLEIDGDCFIKVNRFVIDGLNELKSVIIGRESFYLNNRKGMKCVIMNCDQLKEIHIGNGSFYWYESLKCKNLPSLISIQLDGYAFYRCHMIVFDSMNDWMNDEWDLIQLQSITLGECALEGDCGTARSNELIMKSMNDKIIDWWDLPSLSTFKGTGCNIISIGKVTLKSDDWWLNMN